jgi:hypothetical protein
MMTTTPTRRAGLALRERWSTPLNYIDNGGPERREEATREPWPGVLKYWRTISAEAFDDSTKAEVIAFVQATTTTMPEWQRAISGDAVAAIGMVKHCKPPSSIGIRVDFPMTVLLSYAFEDPGAALVLSQKLRQMPLEARLRPKLVTSWQVANLLLSLRRSRKGTTHD